MQEINKSTRLGWIGLGVMGQSMANHLLKAGYRLTVSTRTKSKAAQILAQGADWAQTPAEVAHQADVIFTMVSLPSDVRDVILGPQGLLTTARPGAIVVDMTTSEPSLAVLIAEKAREKNIESLDAPVSGGDIGAKNATLSIMVGGKQDVFNAVRPLFETIGKTIVYQGPAGCGQHTKMANQILVAAGIIGVCEALLYAWRAGLSLETALQSVSSGAAGSWGLTNYSPRILQGNFEPGFYVEHFLKDLGIAIRESERLQLNLPGLQLAKQLYDQVQAQGYGRKGIHVLQLALAHINDLTWDPQIQNG